MRVVNTGGSTPADWGGQDADTTTTAVRGGEGTLAQVASRLGVDVSDLQQANPQIANPNKLIPGQEIRIPSLSTGGSPGGGATNETSDDGAAAAGTDAGKRMESSLGGSVMRALLNFRQPGDSGTPGGIPAGQPAAGPVTAGGPAPADSTGADDKLKALNENGDFKNLSADDQALVKQTLTANPPITDDKIQKTLDLLGSAKGLSAADHKLVMDGFKGAKADPTYSANLKQLLDDPKFKGLGGDEKTAVLSQTKNYPDARSVKNIDRMLQKDWFNAQSLGDKQRSLKVIARLSQYSSGDQTIYSNTLDKFIGAGSQYKLDWQSMHVDAGTTFGEGDSPNKALILNKDLIAADNDKMVENGNTNHLTLNTVPHEVNHLMNGDKVEENFKYFQAEYRAWYVGFKAENGRAPTNQEAMQQRINWQLDPDSFYGKEAAEAMKKPDEAAKFYEFLGKVTGKTVDASNWHDVVTSNPTTWPDHKSQADAPAPEGNSDNH